MTDWLNCYDESWKGVITDESFAHPAKFSRALIRRIYEHAIGSGFIAEGSTIVDPFGGIAAGAFDALRLGLNWIGCELEPRFVAMAQANIDAWNARYSTMPHWGTARILQGDSRRLCDVLRAADCVVSSPPYTGSALGHSRGKAAATETQPDTFYGSSSGQLGAMREGDVDGVISSPPYNLPMSQDHNGTRGGKRGTTPAEDGAFAKYGNTDGQLEGLPMGDIDAVISSPPYAGSFTAKNSTGIDKRKQWETYRAQGGGMSYDAFVAQQEKHSGEYGDTDGQLARMAEGNADAVISSPPFGEGETRNRSEYAPGYVADMMSRAYTQDKQGTTDGNLATLKADAEGLAEAIVSSPPFENQVAQQDRNFKMPHDTNGNINVDYGNTKGQIGNTQGETFWRAAREIVAQCWQVLRPDGVAIWVCKRFVRNGEIVEFSDQWRRLCESVGFETIEWHHAMLVKESVGQRTLNGDVHVKRTERKSFFRRLAEAKGSPRIDWEDVIVMRKIDAATQAVRE